VEKLADAGADIFLDLKFHDIPNTVAKAVSIAVRLPRVRLLTLHASSGTAVMRAAREAAGNASRRPKLLAVTVLTSFDTTTLREIGMSACGPSFVILIPGVRPRSGAANDQSRIATPAEAIRAGADYLVVGRPITAAPDPRSAVLAIVNEMKSASRQIR
jgi:orotidine-5'-phosphate decarboxylase